MASCVSTPIHSPISMFQTTSLRHYYEGLLDSHHTQSNLGPTQSTWVISGVELMLVISPR